MAELDWSHAVTDIPAAGLSRSRDLTDAERQAIQKALGLISIAKLTVTYRITSIAGDGYRAQGRITGDVEQACIVSLEPVPQKIDEEFDSEFRTELETTDSDHDARVLEGREQELIENGEIAVGRIVFETLSSALDPYPRKDGAEFNWSEPTRLGTEKTNPFAALEKLKNKS